MMNKLAVHFGGGALGRGLTIPSLKEAGYEVVVVDVNNELLNALKINNGYWQEMTDMPSKSKTIEIKDALSFDQTNEDLINYIKQAEIITTSVRRENLQYVAKVLVSILKAEDKKLILCAENVENCGTYFREILEKMAGFAYPNLLIPNTVVDRICTSKWPTSLDLITEEYGEFGFEKIGDLKDIGPIKALEKLEKAFVRKRLLVNTYCDICCFLGVTKGKQYLHESVIDEGIQIELKPYFDLFEKVLVKKYNYTNEEIKYWASLYRKRLSNDKLAHDISSVTRGLWAKLDYSERFLLPLILAIENNIDIEAGTAALCNVINKCADLSAEEIINKCQELWCINETGNKIFATAKKYIIK